MKRTLCEALTDGKCALSEQDQHATQAARHRAHARVTSMEDLIAETPAAGPETADSAVEQILSAYKDCARVLGRDLLAEVKSLMPASQQRI